jgi:hypothetical protein
MKAFRIYTLIMTAGPTVLAAIMVTERRNPDGLFIIALIHFVIYVVVTDLNDEKPKVRRTIRIDPVEEPTSDTVTLDVLKALNQLGYSKRNSHVLLQIVKKRYPHMNIPSVLVTHCLKHSDELKK